MTGFESECVPDDVPPACAAARASLPSRLDREITAEADEVLQHRMACAKCRSEDAAARLLIEGLLKLPPERPNAHLADRIVEQLKSQPIRANRWRRGLLAVGFTLAASVLVVLISSRETNESPAQKQQVEVAIHPQPKPEPELLPTPLTETLNEAGSAVASLTRKTPSINLKLPSVAIPKAVSLDRLEPATTSIQDLGNGAALSVAPIADPTRKAADLFWRQVGLDLDAKPEIN